MTLGRNAVGYLTESLHGAGSPQAQRIQIYRQMQINLKQHLARQLAGIDLVGETEETLDGYFARVFATDDLA
jgi:4-hydroxybutyryl-CoA dehydratase/vinylacetyl-CoA-Delta-isomerase